MLLKAADVLMSSCTGVNDHDWCQWSGGQVVSDHVSSQIFSEHNTDKYFSSITMIIRQIRTSVNYRVLLLCSLSLLGFLEIISRNKMRLEKREAEQHQVSSQIQISANHILDINYVESTTEKNQLKSSKSASKILLLAYARFVSHKAKLMLTIT